MADGARYGTLRVTRHDEVEEVVLNRPDRLNSFNPQMIDDLRHYFHSLQRRPDIRVIIMRGEGRAFCAGADLSETVDVDPGQKVESNLELMEALSDIVLTMRRCPQPIIALLQGAAAGGGMALALAADVRIGTRDLRMIPSFIHIGLSGGEMGLSYWLPRLAGRSVAAEILLAGRTMNAERALQTGLVSDLVESAALFDSGMKLAREMLNASPLGLRMSKDLLNINQDAPSLEAALAAENRTQVLCSQTDYLTEGVAAFFEKRAPNYRKRPPKD